MKQNKTSKKARTTQQLRAWAALPKDSGLFPAIPGISVFYPPKSPGAYLTDIHIKKKKANIQYIVRSALRGLVKALTDLYSVSSHLYNYILTHRCPHKFNNYLSVFEKQSCQAVVVRLLIPPFRGRGRYMSSRTTKAV